MCVNKKKLMEDTFTTMCSEKQIIEEVKERNKFFRAIKKIQKIARLSKDSEMAEIEKICQQALEDS